MVIADTGYWLALANPRDRFHRRAVEFGKSLQDDLITTWPVMTETCHLLLTRLHPSAQLRFIDKAHQGWFQVFPLTQQHMGRVHALMSRYLDLPMDLADASLVILAEELGHGNILSTDQRDFQTYRWKHHHPFRNLLLTT
jgi:predicted nucleic acid-binding protein